MPAFHPSRLSCLSSDLSIYLISVYLSICLSVYLSICLSIYLSIYRLLMQSLNRYHPENDKIVIALSLLTFWTKWTLNSTRVSCSASWGTRWQLDLLSFGLGSRLGICSLTWQNVTQLLKHDNDGDKASKHCFKIGFSWGVNLLHKNIMFPK